MSDPTVRGTVHLIEETKTYGRKGFRKRLLVLEQDKGRYTNFIPIDLVHENCDRADELNKGDEVEISYRLSGRRWQRDEQSEVKFFLSAEAIEYKVLKGGGDGGGTPSDDAPFPDESEAPADDGEVPF